MTNNLLPVGGPSTEQSGASSSGQHHLIHIFVEVTKTDQREIIFDHTVVTGKEIKEAAKVPLDSDLAIREPGGLDELVTNDEPVTIKDGEHFVDLPAGTIS